MPDFAGKYDTLEDIMRSRTFSLTLYGYIIAFALYPVSAFAQALEDTALGDTATDPVNIQYWAIVTGFFLPPVISFIIQSGWSQRLQSAVAFGVALVVTLGQMWLYGQLDNFVDPAGTFLLVMVSTIASYKGFWKPSGIAPAIERGTNLKTA